ncbi:uncharacterized protein [Rutidosis leptorrhynchoides]|uniref:uncharacterized protein n=1 Tax=Rutidosis leptorrhynchoides TaxID=125765 RepID=UPI003A991D37
MESLSRPFHRRKLSNVNGKNAYDGVFSGHRRKFDGAPAVHVDEYREIFGSAQTVSSIPILDLSNLGHQQLEDEDDAASDGLKPDYGLIFGGFHDSDIAVSYQDLIARDKARAHSSTNSSSQDFDDQSHQSFDALKQFNMSYNKISQRSKDGLDRTTHVTQLHAVPGFTCFIDESASQPNKETENLKSYVPNNVPEKQISQNGVESRSKHRQDNSFSGDKSYTTFKNDIKPHPMKASSPPAASSTNNESSSQQKKEPEKQKISVESDNSLCGDKSSMTFKTETKTHPIKLSSSFATSSSNNETSSQSEMHSSSVENDIYSGVNSSKVDFHERQTSKNAFETEIKVCPDESLSDDRNLKTFQVNLKSNPSKVSSLPPVPSATANETSSQSKKETERTNDVDPSVSNSKLDYHEIQTSKSAVESETKERPDASVSDDRNLKTSQEDLNSPHVDSEIGVDSHKGHQKRSTSTNTGTHKSDTSDELPPNCFREEIDASSAAAISAAALRKAIEKAQESIRIAKESVGRKKEGLRGYSNKSFKDSLKVKVKARVPNVIAGEEQKEKDDKLKASRIFLNGGSYHKHAGPVNFSESADCEKLFGAKKVINEIHEKVPESIKNSEMLVSHSDESRDNTNVCSSNEAVGEKTLSKSIENNKNVCSSKEGIGEETSSESIENNKNVCRSKEGVGEETSSESIENNKNVCSSKEDVGEETLSEFIENNTYEAPRNVVQRSNGYLIESCEDPGDKIDNGKTRESNENTDELISSDSHKLAEDLNNLMLYYKGETERNNQNGYEKSFDETLGLLENKKQEFLEQERDENVESDDEARENVLEDEIELIDSESHKEEDNGEEFYDVSEVEIVENAQTSANHNEEKSCEKMDKFEEPQVYENSSSDYDDAEGSENLHFCNGVHIVFDKEEAHKVVDNDNSPEAGPEIDDVSSSSTTSAQEDQNKNNPESGPEIDDVSRSSATSAQEDQNNNPESVPEIDDVSSSSSATSAQEFQVKDTEVIEKDIFENIYVDQISSKDDNDECDDVSNCGSVDVDFVQNDARSESSSDTIHGMEIEVKEYSETEVTMKEEESNVQQSHDETPEIGIKTEIGKSETRKDESGQSGPTKVVEKEVTKRIKEVTAEERERERVKLAVERAIREARERAFIEAREKAARQRVIADAQEKVVKTSLQSKLKAERAAVERATAEARQRALEKAMSQKKISEPKEQVNEVKPSSSVSQTNAESALRSKAKLEKHNRIMERAAQALAEKEKRDMLVLKEQAERSRLADNLDADIKRWSSGKEGNLRALLSTLQYILGAESGWKPVSLTEIITTTAVKKAYRKATLCVHPDKVQQRGASIQQKYICEKVFDLLKAAWNRFNSEER